MEEGLWCLLNLLGVKKAVVVLPRVFSLKVSFNHSPLRASIFVFPVYSVHRTSDLQGETTGN